MGRIAFDPATPVDNEADRSCSILTRLAGEPLAGTATPRSQAWLLLEDPRGWGPQPPARNRRLPETLRTALAERGIRTQLIRRHRSRRAPDSSPTVVAGWVDRERSWLEIGRLTDPIGQLDPARLDDLAGGHRPHLGDLASQPVVLVCTHGGVDPCCAKFGRPVAAALTEAFGPLVWETTHVGGCRFAANLVCLPSGVVYGHTTPELAVGQVEALLAGRIVDAGLRGHAGVTRPVQVAELALRRHTNRWELHAITLTAYRKDGTRWGITACIDDTTFEVTVATAALAERPYGCGDAERWTPQGWQVVAVTETETSATGRPNA